MQYELDHRVYGLFERYPDRQCPSSVARDLSAAMFCTQEKPPHLELSRPR